jgi:anti-sigma factor RsiW
VSVEDLTCQELVEVVTEYLEGAMPAEHRTRFEEHLAYCSWCQTYLAQMRETVEVTGMLREDDLSAEARDALLRVFRDWKEP